LRDELKTTYRGLDYTIRLKRFSVGQAMLRVLNIARRLSKSAENAISARTSTSSTKRCIPGPDLHDSRHGSAW
jgi:hypothetical protein